MNSEIVSKLVFLTTSLFVNTHSSYEYSLDVEQDGTYSIKWSDRERTFLKTIEQVVDFFASKNIISINMLNHDTDEETVLYRSRV